MSNPEKIQKSASRSKGQFVDELFAATGRPCRVETIEGGVRTGRLSGLRVRTLKYNGFDQEIVEEIELNRDPSDTIPLSRIAILNID
jgi:hypothetical protein